MRLLKSSVLSLMLLALSPAQQARAQGDLRGHGGPVRALAIAPAGKIAISGSFDHSAILWSLESGRALRILRAHEGSVNAVLAREEQFVTAGDDGRIALWRKDSDMPDILANRHEAPVSGLALSPDGRTIASSSWDGLVKAHDIATLGTVRVFAGHAGIVNAVVFLPDGLSVASAGYDATVRIWRLDGAGAIVVKLPAPANGLAVTREGVIAVGCADGSVILVSSEGVTLGSVEATETPVTSLAASTDGKMLAAGSPRGAVALIDIATLRVLFTLNGPGLPVWSLAFTPDGKHLLTGGADRIVRRWDAASGEHIGAIAGAGADDDLGSLRDMPGAEIFKACAVCHTLRADGAGRAGPTLYGLFGRRAGSVAGYSYSDAFRKLDLVWTPETVGRLFEIGPQAYTPGTKMPEQTVGNARERQALIDFLIAATAPK